MNDGGTHPPRAEAFTMQARVAEERYIYPRNIEDTHQGYHGQTETEASGGTADSLVALELNPEVCDLTASRRRSSHSGEFHRCC